MAEVHTELQLLNNLLGNDILQLVHEAAEKIVSFLDGVLKFRLRIGNVQPAFPFVISKSSLTFLSLLLEALQLLQLHLSGQYGCFGRLHQCVQARIEVETHRWSACRPPSTDH